MTPAAPPSVTLIAGASGTGKTTLALKYLLNVQGVVCRFVFDPDEEVASRLRVTPARTSHDLEGSLSAGWVVYDPHLMFPGRVEDGFAFFCDWSYQVSTRGPGRKVLMLDEAWRYCDPHSIPAELALVVQTGRKRQLEPVFVTQRPHRLNGSITNEVTEVIAFRLQEPAALDRVAELGLNAAEVRDLPPGCFISRNCRSGSTLRASVFA